MNDNIQYILQQWSTQSYTDLFRIALNNGTYEHIYSAVAYATVGGVRTLDSIFRAELGTRMFNRMSKKWLVGIDWCRSAPNALDMLDNFNESEVKIPNGIENVSRSGCLPSKTFHPKLYILKGKDLSAIICGSGNLSFNGLTKSCECGNLLIVKSSKNKQLSRLLKWFDSLWNEADPYKNIMEVYRKRCKVAIKTKATFTPTEDDLTPEVTTKRPASKKSLSEFQIRQLQIYDNLWIEAGKLGANLGPDKPGNQLDMKRYTRVFFGYPAVEVSANQIIGHISIEWNGNIYHNRTIKFGNNGMDKLNVPSAGDLGPLFYKNKTLLFTKAEHGSFLLTVGNNSHLTRWRRMSKQLNASYSMTPSGREWGLF